MVEHQNARAVWRSGRVLPVLTTASTRTTERQPALTACWPGGITVISSSGLGGEYRSPIRDRHGWPRSPGFCSRRMPPRRNRWPMASAPATSSSTRCSSRESKCARSGQMDSSEPSPSPPDESPLTSVRNSKPPAKAPRGRSCGCTAIPTTTAQWPFVCMRSARAPSCRRRSPQFPGRTAAGHAKRLVRQRTFGTFEEASRFVASQPSQRWRIASSDPLTSCVPIEALPEYRQVFQSIGQQPTSAGEPGPSFVQIYERSVSPVD